MTKTEPHRPSRVKRSLPLVVRRSTTGLGVFAVRRINAGRWLLEYVGPRLSEAEAAKRGGRYLMEAGPDTYIDGRGRENTARYLNYACYPNCEASIERGRVWIRSVRTIEANEELTLDFGEQYARAFFWRSGCLCAACRRRR